MIQRLLLVAALGGVVIGLYTVSRTAQPDPQLIRLAVRATVYAMPTAPPQVVEVTRIVEITRVVERVSIVEVTPSSTLTPTATSTPTPLAQLPPPALAEQVQAASFVAPAGAPQAELAADAPATVEITSPADTLTVTEPPPATAAPDGCPPTSDRQYTSIPVAGGGLDHPDALHGDLNLALRGYTVTNAAATLVSINGPTDGDPPQLAALFADGRTPTLTQTWRVHDWDWSCGPDGCRGGELNHVEVSLIGMQTTPGEPLMPPSRGADIYAGGVKAVVLYAETGRLTLGYTREATVANGYAVHIESLCVDPNLVHRYQADNAAGRSSLPGLRAGDVIGVAAGDQIAVAIRDRGAFADPRSRKDWWHGR